MRFQIRLLGRELFALEADQPQQPTSAPQQLSEAPQDAPATQPDIPAEFGFHGGAGGSQERAYRPYDYRRPPLDRSQP